MALLVGGATFLAAQAHKVDVIFPGVQAEGVDLSGMTLEEARLALEEVGHQRYDKLAVTASLPLDNTLTISAGEAGLEFTGSMASAAAWNYGRDKGLVENLFT